MRWFESWDGVAFQTNWSSKRRGSWHQWPLDERLKYLKMTMARCWRTARWSGNGNKGPTFKLAIPFAHPYKRSYIGLSQNGGCPVAIFKWPWRWWFNYTMAFWSSVFWEFALDFCCHQHTPNSPCISMSSTAGNSLGDLKDILLGTMGGPVGTSHLLPSTYWILWVCKK